MNNTALLIQNSITNKWEAIYNGIKLCHSDSKGRVIDTIKQGKCAKATLAGVTDITENINFLPTVSVVPNTVTKTPEFSIDQRFKFVTDLTNMVINGRTTSLIVSGGPGLGKSYTVEKCFKDANMLDESIVLANTDIAPGITKTDYITNKGFTSAKGLYTLLHDYRNSIIVFDDCDKVLENKDAIMLLKGALDTTGSRYVSWNVDAKHIGKLPTRFQFTGRMIFITNKSLKDVDGAIMTRSMCVDLVMTTQEILDRMEFILVDVLPNVDYWTKLEVLEFIKEKAHLSKTLSLRTLEQLCNIRLFNDSNWTQLAEYTLITQSQ